MNGTVCSEYLHMVKFEGCVGEHVSLLCLNIPAVFHVNAFSHTAIRVSLSLCWNIVWLRICILRDSLMCRCTVPARMHVARRVSAFL
jgi:hypothetical protein